MASQINEFDPVVFSDEENIWLLEVIGKPASVALNGTLPKGVNYGQVKPFLQRFDELEALLKHENQPWVGFEAIKEAIKIYQREDNKWKADHSRKRNAPRFPSLYSYDSKGRPHLGGPGSDSGHVRTWFDSTGKRVPFAIALVPDWAPLWTAPGVTETVEAGLLDNSALNRWECFCGHTEQYKPGSRASQNAARARMSKHLRRATEDVDRHREIHTGEFGQASV